MGEMFYRFDAGVVYTDTEVRTYNYIDKYRIRAGVKYKFNNRNQLALSGIYQSALDHVDVRTNVGISWSYTIRGKLFKKKEETEVVD